MEAKTSKLLFDEILIGMKFYTFTSEESDEYTLYYVTKTYITKNNEYIILRNFENNSIVKLSYDEYVKSDKYILLDDYYVMKFNIGGYKTYRPTYEGLLFGERERYYILFEPYIKPGDCSDLSFNSLHSSVCFPIPLNLTKECEDVLDNASYNSTRKLYYIAIYRFETTSNIDKITKYLINHIIDTTDKKIDKEYPTPLQDMILSNITNIPGVNINDDLKLEIALSKYYSERNKVIKYKNALAINASIKDTILFRYVPDNYIILGKNPELGKSVSLKEYTVDYPDNIIPQEVMNHILSTSRLTKEITNYELFRYDESVNLKNIKLPHLIIYSGIDDLYYIMLYKTGRSLYELEYEYGHDDEMKELIKFMVKKIK